jgi:hypothetical protein
VVCEHPPLHLLAGYNDRIRGLNKGSPRCATVNMWDRVGGSIRELYVVAQEV